MVTLPHTRQSRQAPIGRFDLWVAGVLLLIPIVVFWYVWATYAVNVPKWDDHVLKALFFYLDKESSFSGKLYQFFRQHNEHRIVYDRVVAWLDFSLFGKLNFTHLMAIGNLSLLGLVAIFGLAISQSGLQTGSPARTSLRKSLIYLPPVAFLLLNLSQWENMFWGMAALQNFTVIFWVFWVIYLLSFTTNIGAALLLAILATLTSGNGLVIWPVGFGLLLLQQLTTGRSNRKPLLFWAATAVITIGLYFFQYEKPAGNPPLRGSLLELLTGWLAFTGSAAEAFPFDSVIDLSVGLGGLILAGVLGALVFLLKKWLNQRTLTSSDFFFIGAVVFLVGTGAVVAWTRTGFGLNTLITSRYKLYSLLLLAVLYTYLIGQLPLALKKWGLRFGLIVSIPLMASSYRTYLDDAIWWRQWMLTNQFNWSYTANRPVLTLDPNTIRLLINAPAFYDKALPGFYTPASGPSMPLASVQKDGTNFTLTDTLTPTPVSPDGGTYLLLRSDKRLYLFQTTPAINITWQAKTGLASLFANGFSSSLSEADLQPAIYQIERVRVNTDGTINRFPTGQTIQTTATSHYELPKNW